MILDVFFTQQIHVYFLTTALLLYIKPRYIPLAVATLGLLYYQQNNPTQTLLCYQTSILCGVLCCLKHNRRYSGSIIIWLMLLSFGILINSMSADNQEFFTQLLQKLKTTITQTQTIDYTVITNTLKQMTLLMLIGLIPFNKQIMHLFTISNNFFKLICFVVPMYLLLLLLQLNNNTTAVWLGWIMCVYSGIHCVLENKIRHLLVYIITFFYGLNMVSTMQNHQYVCMLNFIWLMLCVAVLAYTKIIAPKKTQVYLIHNLKTLIGETKINKLLSLCFSIIVVFVLTTYYKTNNFTTQTQYWLNILILSLFLAFTAKILYILYFMQSQQSNTTTNTPNTTETIKTAIVFAFVIVCILHIFTHKQTPNAVLFTKQTRYGLILCCIVFISSLLLSRFLIISKKSKLLDKIQHNHITQVLLDVLKVVIDIIYISIKDFFKVIKNNTQNTISSSTPNKLTNLLSNNQMYFYIFFLIEIIVVLTIECVIT